MPRDLHADDVPPAAEQGLDVWFRLAAVALGKVGQLGRPGDALYVWDPANCCLRAYPLFPGPFSATTAFLFPRQQLPAQQVEGGNTGAAGPSATAASDDDQQRQQQQTQQQQQQEPADIVASSQTYSMCLHGCRQAGYRFDFNENTLPLAIDQSGVVLLKYQHNTGERAQLMARKITSWGLYSEVLDEPMPDTDRYRSRPASHASRFRLVPLAFKAHYTVTGKFGC